MRIDRLALLEEFEIQLGDGASNDHAKGNTLAGKRCKIEPSEVLALVPSHWLLLLLPLLMPLFFAFEIIKQIFGAIIIVPIVRIVHSFIRVVILVHID